jgi:hypothetical protein
MPSNINLQNNVQNLQLTTVVGGGLSSSYYSINATSAPPMTPTNYLTFNRDQGITNGQTYTFTTMFAFGSIQFTILVSLTGTATQSNFWIQVSAANQANGTSAATPQISDTGTTSLGNGPLSLTAFNGNVLNFAVSVTRFLNGSFDDVTITMSPS